MFDWGGGYVGDSDLEDILSDVSNASDVKLDRWQIKIQKINLRTGTQLNNKPSKITYMNNYFSIGCDALVTLNFDRQRNNSYFANRIMNKVIFSLYLMH